MSNTQLIYCSKGKASVSNDRDGTFFNEIGNGIVVEEGDEISVEQVCINSIGIGADVIEVPAKIQNYPYSTSAMTLNCFYYINQNFRYMCSAPPNNMTQATDIVTTITADDYGYISDTYTYPALPVTNLESNNGYIGESGGRRFYVGGYFSNPNELKQGGMYPLKAYGGVRVYPTQEGHCFSCLESNIRFDVDIGYDSPSNIAEKITVDMHSANASVQFGRNNSNQINARIFGNFQNAIPQMAVLDEDCCSTSINGLAGLYTTTPNSYNFYGALFATDNPFYLIYGSRLLSKYVNDGGSGPKNNELVQVLGAGGVAHDNDIYNVFDLPFQAGPPIQTVIPDNYILVTNLPYNESTLKILHKFMKTQKIFTEGSSTLTTDDLESPDIKKTYYMPLQFGRQKNNDPNITVALQSPLTDPATQPPQLFYTLRARVFFDENQLGNYTLPPDFLAEGASIADSALITYEGQEYTAVNLAKKLDIMIRCIDTGPQGNNQLNVAFSMFEGQVLDKKGYHGDYCLVDLGLQNPLCIQNVLVNPDIIDEEKKKEKTTALEKFMEQQLLLIESQKEVMKKMNTLVDNKPSHHIHQNNGIINNKININLYLNNNCKNAVNLIDFIENLQLTIEDLCTTHQLGYVNGMSQILSKNLENLKPTERPIHCDNGNKNIQFYIKDKDHWEEDIDMNKLDKSLETLSKKQIEVLKDWAVTHPNWMKCEKETEIYMEMVKQCMGGSNPIQSKKNKEEIKKAISKEVSINDVIEV